MKNLEQFKKYIEEMEYDAGDACQASEGTMGCDEANFYRDILKEIDKFLALSPERKQTEVKE